MSVMTEFVVCVECGRKRLLDLDGIVYGQASEDGQFACADCTWPEEQEEDQ
jgi:hypothetical protein